MRYRPAFALFMLVLWGAGAISASAQGLRSSRHVLIQTSSAELAAPISPVESAGPLTLDACIDLGFQHQPA